MFTPDHSSNEFLADFGSADPFSSSTQTSVTTQPSFANFENNPIFNSSSKYYLTVHLIVLRKQSLARSTRGHVSIGTYA
jgi:hypothetical protein